MKHPMKRILILFTLVLSVGLIAAGCGNDDGDSSSTAAAAPDHAEQTSTTETTTEAAESEPAVDPEPKPEPKPKGTKITTAESPFGDVLFGGNGQAIYLFDIESSDVSECYGDCATAWPPVLTKGEPQAKGDVDGGKLGTTKRDDGTTQVTYNGHPLYYYAHEGPGVVSCHNVTGFGGLWLALDASGNSV